MSLSSSPAQFLTIVSGLPRSGTSMMMRMLEMGGMPVMIDHIRSADDDNPNGYYEFEAVKQTREDASWLESSDEKAVKMVYRLLYDLPENQSYRVLFMRRNLKEVLASQKVMLDRNGADGGGVTDAQMQQLFELELDKFYGWVSGKFNFQLINVDYNELLAEPRKELLRVNEFLGGTLDIGAMVSVIDAKLYRNRVTVSA
jgi:hypothetical protein